MYLALARKYRPQKFGELIGQSSICKTLQNSIAMNKVYPALIFSGMKGVGKTSAARILAKALNCEQGPAIEPCNQCPTCQEITDDNSADYLEIDGASNNGVNEVRSLRETVKYKPIKNRFRMVVIDEVHMLSTAAWNALLKTIEEPPEHTIFIMATTDFHKIPATIVSRCQHFEFKRIPHEVIQTVLTEICKKEKIKISDYALRLIARSAEGSLRDAKKILDQAIAISQGNVNDQDVADILGVIDEEIFIALTAAVFEKDRQAIITRIDDLSARGIDLRFFYIEYLKFFRDLIVVKSIPDADKLHSLNPENMAEIKKLIAPVSEIELLRYFNAVKEMDQMIKNTENPSVILEFMFLKLSYFPALVEIEEVLKRLRSERSERSERSPGGAPPTVQPTGGGAAAGPAGEPAVAPVKGSGDETVANFKTKVEQDKPRLASILAESALTLKNNLLTIELPRQLENAGKVMKENRAYLKQVAGELAGREIAVEILPAASQDNEDEEGAAIQQLKEDKNIARLREMLKGKLISVEVIKRGKDE